MVTEPASPAPRFTSLLSPNQTRWLTKVASGLIGVTVSKKRKPQVSNFSDSLKRMRSVFVPSTTEIRRMSPCVAEATRLYPAPAVVPVFIPSTLTLLLQSRRLRLGWRILLKVNSFSLWMAYSSGTSWISALPSSAISRAVLN